MTKKERLQKLYKEGLEFVDKGLTASDKKFNAWKNSLFIFLEQFYGKESTIIKQFNDISFSPMVFTSKSGNSLFVKYFNDGMKEILENLKRLIEDIDDINEYQEPNKNKEPFINVNVDASNTNSISNVNENHIVVYNYEEVQEKIEDNTFLDDNSKAELLNILNEIKEIEKSKDSKSKKWSKAKKILEFIIDKGADIAIMYVPLIIKAISK